MNNYSITVVSFLLDYVLTAVLRARLSLLENVTDDSIAKLFVTKFSSISLYLNKLFYVAHRALR